MNCLFCNKKTLQTSTFSFGKVEKCENCNVLYHFLNDKFTGYSFSFNKDIFTYNFSCFDKLTIFYITSFNNPSYYKSVNLDRLFSPDEAKSKLPLILTML